MSTALKTDQNSNTSNDVTYRHRFSVLLAYLPLLKIFVPDVHTFVQQNTNLHCFDDERIVPSARGPLGASSGYVVGVLELHCE